MELASRSNHQPEERPWLREKVYNPRRSRTVELVKSSVGSLMKDGKRISLAALSARSKEIDPDRRGISESAIFKNQEARLCYEQHRSWKASSGNRTRTLKLHCVTVTAGIKRDRDTARVRYRYLKWSKADLVARLVAVENAHAALQEGWLEVNRKS